jgi:hypothetical protein
MNPEAQDTFDVLRGAIIIDYELEHICQEIKMQDLRNTISKNDWWDSRKKEANQARRKYESLQRKQHHLEEFVETIARQYKLDADMFDYDDLFKNYNITLKIVKKTKT